MSDTLVKFKTGTIESLASKKTVDGVQYPSVPLESGSVYFAVDTDATDGKIVYDYALERTGLSDWSATTSYAKDAEVTYNGKYYKSFVANNIGHVPYGAADSYNYWREIVTRVVMGTKFGLDISNGNLSLVKDGDVMTVALPDNNTWQANTSTQEGYVASGANQANKVWKTDANGNPAWRNDTDTKYSAATSSTLGLMKLGSDTVQSVAANTPSTEAGRTYPVQFNSSNQAVVNVPWTDENTWQAATTGQVGYIPKLSGTATQYLNGSGQWSTPPNDNTTYGLSISGHTVSLVAGGSTTSVTVPDNNDNTWQANTATQEGYVSAPGTSDAGKNKVWKTDSTGTPGWRDDANNTYSLATNTNLGLIKPWFNHTKASTGPTAGSDAVAVTVNAITSASGKYYAVEADSNGRMFVNVPWANDNTWQANSKTQEGYVASGSGQANKVWKTDSEGNPAWRNDENTTYSTATTSALGLVKLGSDTAQTVAANSVTATSGKTYAIQLNSSNQMVVNVPWTDNNTWQANTSGQEGYVSAPPTGDDGKNKVWKTDSSGVPGWRNDANNTYSLAKYNNLGLVKPAYSSTGAVTLTTAAAQNSSTPTIAAKTTTAGRYYGVETDKNGILFVNVPWEDNNTWQAATTGQVGYMPQLSGTATQYLNGSGQWSTPPNDNTTYGLSISDHTVSLVAGGTTTSVTIPDNNDNTWQANLKNQAGYVASPNSQTNMIWMTNSTDGTPAWTSISNLLNVADALVYKGTIGSSGATVTSLPTTHSVGWTYKVATAGTYAGISCEIGDLITCITDGTSANNAHWTVVQTNLDGAVTSSSTSSVDNRIARFDGTTGRIIQTNGNVTIDDNGKLTTNQAINQIITGSGTAGANNGSGDTKYTPALWTFNTGAVANDGDIYTIKIPVAGHANGVYMSVDNGDIYYPVVLNGTGRITTHYPVNNYIQVIFESAGSAASMTPLGGAAAANGITVTGGVFRVINYYDANTTYSAMSADEMRTGTATSNRIMHAAKMKDAFLNDGTSTSAIFKAGTSNGDLKVYGTDITVYTHPTYTSKTSGLYKITVDGTGHVSGTAAVTKGDIPALDYLPLGGGTMTGVITAKSSAYADDGTTCAINMKNSNIIGLNSIYTADASDNAGEGIHFYRDATHVDTLWMNGGDLLFVPNRALGTSTTKANSQKVGRFTANPTSGQVVITDGTTGGMKSSGYTIAKSVPSDAVFTDTTYDAEKGISLSSGKFGHSNAAITAQTTQAVYPIKIDAYGHITAYGTAVTSMTPASHTHGKITNDGKIASTDNVTIANNDRLIISDASDSYILKNSSITFDGSTATKALTQKGTWETFNNYSHPTGDGNLHVPATSTTSNGKFLKAGSTEGSISWASLTSSDITTALGFTPYNATNPSGYTTNTGTVTKVTAGTGLTTTSGSSTDGGNFTTSGTLYLTKTAVTAGSYGPSANASPAHAAGFSVPYFTVDAYGRITAASTKTITLPSDSNTDTKVTQTATTTNADYEILFSETADNTTRTEAARKTSGLKFNPSTNGLQLSSAVTLQYNSTTKSLDFIFA